MPNFPSLVGSSGDGCLNLSGGTCWRKANCSSSLSLFPPTLGRDLKREAPCRFPLSGAVLDCIRFKSRVWRCRKSFGQVFTSVTGVVF